MDVSPGFSSNSDGEIQDTSETALQEKTIKIKRAGGLAASSGQGDGRHPDPKEGSTSFPRLPLVASVLQINLAKMQRGHRLFTRARAAARSCGRQDYLPRPSRSMLPSSRMGHQSYRGVDRRESSRLASTSRSTPPKDEAQAAIERSQQLHAELKQMIEAQKTKAAEERAKPLGSNFVKFVKSSKPEMIK